MKFGQFASVGQSMSGTFLPLVLLSFTAMVSSCIAYGCTNRSKSGSGQSFFRFPLKKQFCSQNGYKPFTKKTGLQTITLESAVTTLIPLVW